LNADPICYRIFSCQRSVIFRILFRWLLAVGPFAFFSHAHYLGNRAEAVNSPLPKNTVRDIETRTADIKLALETIEADVQGINRYRYEWQLQCLEEYIEAISFAHYLQHQTIISAEDAAKAIPADIELTPHDYMFGLFDLFGEMMRFATVTTAHTGALAGAGSASGRTILSDIHELSSSFEILPRQTDRAYTQKLEAMRTSVRKVEKLGYGLAIRGTERPRGWVPDMKNDFEPFMED
jgi:predicted translin family RNA/ssDNA-binding protein